MVRIAGRSAIGARRAAPTAWWWCTAPTPWSSPRSSCQLLLGHRRRLGGRWCSPDRCGCTRTPRPTAPRNLARRHRRRGAADGAVGPRGAGVPGGCAARRRPGHEVPRRIGRRVPRPRRSHPSAQSSTACAVFAASRPAPCAVPPRCRAGRAAGDLLPGHRRRRRWRAALGGSPWRGGRGVRRPQRAACSCGRPIHRGVERGAPRGARLADRSRPPRANDGLAPAGRRRCRRAHGPEGAARHHGRARQHARSRDDAIAFLHQHALTFDAHDRSTTS